MKLESAKNKVRQAIKLQARYQKMQESPEYKNLGFRNLVSKAFYDAMPKLGYEDSNKFQAWFHKLDVTQAIAKEKEKLT